MRAARDSTCKKFHKHDKLGVTIEAYPQCIVKWLQWMHKISKANTRKLITKILALTHIRRGYHLPEHEIGVRIFKALLPSLKMTRFGKGYYLWRKIYMNKTRLMSFLAVNLLYLFQIWSLILKTSIRMHGSSSQRS